MESDTDDSIARHRLSRVRWFCEWLEDEVADMNADRKYRL